MIFLFEQFYLDKPGHKYSQQMFDHFAHRFFAQNHILLRVELTFEMKKEELSVGLHASVIYLLFSTCLLSVNPQVKCRPWVANEFILLLKLPKSYFIQNLDQRLREVSRSLRILRL